MLVALLALCIGFIAGEKLTERQAMVCRYIDAYDYENYQHIADWVSGKPMKETSASGVMAQPSPDEVANRMPEVIHPEDPDGTYGAMPDIGMPYPYYPPYYYHPYPQNNQVLICRHQRHVQWHRRAFKAY